MSGKEWQGAREQERTILCQWDETRPQKCYQIKQNNIIFPFFFVLSALFLFMTEKEINHPKRWFRPANGKAFDGQNTQHSYRNTFEKCNALNTWWTSNESLLMECIATGTLGGVQANLWVLPSENIGISNKLNQRVNLNTTIFK